MTSGQRRKEKDWQEVLAPKRRLEVSQLDESVWLPPAATNPFDNNTSQLTYYEIFKLATFGLVVAPLRFLIALVTLVLATLLAKIALVGLSQEELYAKPLTPWRKRFIDSYYYLGRFMLLVLGFWWINVKGKPDPKAKIVVSNHVSFADIPFYVYYLRPAPLSRIENASIPIIKELHYGLQAILVSRDEEASRQNAKKTIKERSIQPSWPPTLIFPEGTTSNGKSLITFKPGAFIPGEPVQPVVLRFPHVHLDLCWVNGSPSPLMLVWRILSQPVIHLEVQFLPTHYPSQEEKQDAMLFAENVRHRMASALNVPVTSHSFADVKLGLKAANYGFPGQLTSTVEVDTVQKRLGLSFDEMLALVAKFMVINKSKDGEIKLEEFVDQFRDMNVNENTINQFFHALDLDNSGAIDYREFLVGSVAIGNILSGKSVCPQPFTKLFENKSFVAFWQKDHKKEADEEIQRRQQERKKAKSE
ncbi:Lysophosphatidylcholine acyltransferase 1 [Balamuthia mandrillaris]